MPKGGKKAQLGRYLVSLKKYYDRLDEVNCPILRSKVIFNDDGWRHITNPYENTPNEIRDKVNLLSFSVRVLGFAKKYKPEKINGIRRVVFKEKIDNRLIIVVVMYVNSRYQFRTNWAENILV